jgi:lipopolysaccharide/colanic/teichoic acid biosynthesis glycosyltransferase
MDRFAVKPGLTGLWQVSGRNKLTMTEGLRYDLEYVANQSVRMDLLIILKTIPAVLGGAR